MSVPKGVNSRGVSTLGVSIPGGVDTWRGDPWRCWYLGVQVPMILVPRNVGTRWCWYLGARVPEV